MTDAIRTRIEAIKNGELPEGYKNTKAGVMPEDWDGAIRAKQLFKSHTDKEHNGDLEILASTQGRGIVPRNQIGIDIQCSDEGVKGYKKVSKGDFVISLRSFQGGIEYSEYDGIVSPAYIILKPIKDISAGFYRNYFKTDSFIDRLNGAVYGIRDGKQIGYEEFGDMYVHCPPLVEQERIADILMQCDKVIELKRKRIAEEKKKKKYLMQTLLSPTSGVRLPGFSGAWKNTRIGDVAKMFSGGTPTSSNQAYYAVSGIPFIRSGEISLSKTALYLSQAGYNNSTAKMVSKGDLLYALYGANSGECFISKIDGAINQAILCIRSEVVDTNYMYYVLANRKDWIVATYLQGGQGNLSGEIIKKLVISYPERKEQSAIYAVLNAQDSVIDKLEEELYFYQEKKTALAQLLLTGIVRTKV